MVHHGMTLFCLEIPYPGTTSRNKTTQTTWASNMITAPLCTTKVRSLFPFLNGYRMQSSFFHIKWHKILCNPDTGDSFSTNGDLTMITKDPNYQVRGQWILHGEYTHITQSTVMVASMRLKVNLFSTLIQFTIGKQKFLSFTDAKIVNKMYNCNSHCNRCVFPILPLLCKPFF